MTVDRILRVLNSHRFPITTESRLQEAMHSALVDEGIPAVREFRLSAGSRIDLFVRDVGVGIECKIKGGRRDIWRQVERYCEHDQITALILATNVAMALPAEVHGKPTHVLHLARAWM